MPNYWLGTVPPGGGQHVGGPRCTCKLCELKPEQASDFKPDHRLRLDRATRGRVERGAQTAYLSAERPAWAQGDLVAVYRSWAAETPDTPLVLTVSSVGVVKPAALTAEDARRLGFPALLDLHRDLAGTQHLHALALKARVDRLPDQWMTRWSVHVPHERRLLAPSIGDSGVPGYVSSFTTPQMSSAGEAVTEDVLRRFSMDADKGIRDAQDSVLAGYAASEAAKNALREAQWRAEKRRRPIRVLRTESSRVVDVPREEAA